MGVGGGVGGEGEVVGTCSQDDLLLRLGRRLSF